jgi:hypothetical protein
MTKKKLKPWTPRLWVVEIWWEHSSYGEWLYHDSFLVRRAALDEVKKARRSGYQFRVVSYVPEKK